MMRSMTRSMTRSMVGPAGLLAIVVLAGCQSADPAHEDEDHAESWAFTAWGAHFEIFAEAAPLVANEMSKSHTHVTVLEGFRPLREGVVSIVLRGDDGQEQVFSRNRALRDGIFEVLVQPQAAGEYALSFRVQAEGLTDEIAAGRVVVGTAEAPGHIVEDQNAVTSVEEVAFLKEQQWQTHFASAAVEAGRIRESARGTGRVRPAAGGELHLASPVDGIVASEPWPHVGLERNAGQTVLALSSRVSQGRTLAELEAVDTEKTAELRLAQERLERLEGLLAVGAVSDAEVDAARARVQTLQAQAESARRQMAAAGGPGGASTPRTPVLEVRAPFTGEVAEVLVGPGQAVAAGDPLVRMVQTEPVWVEVQLAPQDAQRLQTGASGLWVRTTADREWILFEADRVRLVSIAPEVDVRTGRVTALIQVVTGDERLRLGATIEAEVLLAEAREGAVVPSSAIVDDSGIATVFVQRGGETFERREVAILGREGDLYLVEGLLAGERVVTAGGAAIRRASLVSSGGADHGHVH